VNARNRKSRDELHRSVNAKALEFKATHPQDRLSPAKDDPFWTDIHQLVLRIVEPLLYQSEIEAEDVAQVIVGKAWIAFPRFGYKSQFTTWLFRIVVRTVADFRRGIRKNVISLQDLSANGHDGEQQVPEPSAPTVDIIRVISVEQKLKKLSPEDADIIKRWWRGESPELIGRRLGKHTDAIRQRINRALRRLTELREQEKQVELRRTSRRPP
jgi:RNA polymerase sigma factor (sigma-70 family)